MSETRLVSFSNICRERGDMTPAMLARACDHHGIPVVQLVPNGKRMLAPADYERLLSRVKNGGRDD
jgi:hypothetical protein